MAKPRVFISSTYYDLKQTRSDIATFINSLGFESIRNEEGNIPYGTEEELQSYCYKEISNVDILVSIIGGRYGSTSSDGHNSVSNKELLTALKNGVQVYIFIDKNVYAEYETYLLNKSSKDIKFKYVDDIRIYQFIEEIKQRSNNNNIKPFDTSNEIQTYLKEQLAGLFQTFLATQRNSKTFEIAEKLENSVTVLEKLVDFLKESNEGKSEEINRLLIMNHPFVIDLKKKLNINFGIWVDSRQNLENLLSNLSWTISESEDAEGQEYIQWGKQIEGQYYSLKISNSIFEANGSLRDFNRETWKESFVQMDIVTNRAETQSADDLPF